MRVKLKSWHLGPSGACDAPHMDLRSLETYVKSTIKKNLGVIMDSDFKFDKQILNVATFSLYCMLLLRLASITPIPSMPESPKPPSFACSESKALPHTFWKELGISFRICFWIFKWISWMCFYHPDHWGQRAPKIDIPVVWVHFYCITFLITVMPTVQHFGQNSVKTKLDWMG